MFCMAHVLRNEGQEDRGGEALQESRGVGGVPGPLMSEQVFLLRFRGAHVASASSEPSNFILSEYKFTAVNRQPSCGAV